MEKIRKNEIEEAMIQKTKKETEHDTSDKDHSRKCNRNGEWSNDVSNGGGLWFGHYNYIN